MPDDDGLLHRQRGRHRDARVVLGALQVLQRWEPLGVVRLCGSVAHELVVAPDIDVEIVGAPNIRAGFELIGCMAEHPRVRKVLFLNDLDGPDAGLGWEVTYRYRGVRWKVQMWLVPPESAEPLAADLVGPVLAALDRERRLAILRIKEHCLQHAVRYQSIDLLRAVLDDGVRTPDEYQRWAAANRSSGLVSWLPTPLAPSPR